MNLANLATSKYNHPDWQNIALFPWMQDEALKLSEVYTSMEMEEYLGRYRKRVAVPMRDYTELFKNLKPEGTRILVTGDPGIGKTTFIHKLAYDWAMGNLDMFDVVLVVKLKYATKTQSIASMVEDQIGPIYDEALPSQEAVRQYMKSGRDRVLLVLDGIDEINLKQYKQVQEVLRGDAYRRCCILATTRPHVAETLKNKMTVVAKIKGFSRIKAEEFISHILQDKEERKKFFQQIDRRKMSEMHKVPIVIQALALLYRQKKQLPSTYTLTYDDLVVYLRNTYKSNSPNEKVMSQEEIQEAMKEASELAFKGLTREDRQLVFLREEIKNGNVFKLGLLSGEKTGSGFRPTAVLQFVHKTVQEHSASDHVVSRLHDNDRSPWETLLKQFRVDAERNLAVNDELTREEDPQQSTSEAEDERSQTKILSTAVTKVMNVMASHPRRNAFLLEILHLLTVRGAFDEEVDVTSIWNGFKDHPAFAEVLTREEKEVIFDFIALELLIETAPEWRAQQKHWVENIDPRCDAVISTWFLGLQTVTNWIQKDPDMAKEKLKEMAAVFTSNGNLPTQSVSQDFTHLWDHLGSYKTLFRFIIGKLSPELLQEILLEIALLAVRYSFDESTGGVLPFYLLQSLIEDLLRENRPEDTLDVSLVSPPLMHLKLGTLRPTNRKCHLSAVKISGGKDIGQTLIYNLMQQLATIRTVHTAELEDITLGAGHAPRLCADFVGVLYQSRIVSLELRNVASSLTSQLTRRLPPSVKRLSIARNPLHPDCIYYFPQEVNLVSLYIEYCAGSLIHAFRSSFPNLKKMSVINKHYWNHDEITVLLDAVDTGRMPLLEELNIRFGNLKGLGQQLSGILTHPTMRFAELIGVNLGPDDGRILLERIQESHMDHIYNLNLHSNDGLGSTTQELQQACRQHRINLQVSPPQSSATPATPMDFLMSSLISASSAGNRGERKPNFGTVAQTILPLLTTAAQGTTNKGRPHGSPLLSMLQTVVSPPSQPGGSPGGFPASDGSVLSTLLQTVSSAAQQAHSSEHDSVSRPDTRSSNHPKTGQGQGSENMGRAIGLQLLNVATNALSERAHRPGAGNSRPERVTAATISQAGSDSGPRRTGPPPITTQCAPQPAGRGQGNQYGVRPRPVPGRGSESRRPQAQQRRGGHVRLPVTRNPPPSRRNTTGQANTTQSQDLADIDLD